MISAGTQVGSYRLIRILGKPGEDGEVWEAVKHLNPPGAELKHAVKLLHNLTPEAHARFDKEIKDLARVQAEIKSPHLIEIYDGGMHSDGGKQIPFYAMKLLTKPKRLDDYLTSLGMEPTGTSSMFQEAIEGLRDLHDRLDRNHTDIKGSNLLVSMDTLPKLYITDFGFIRERGKEIDKSRTWKNTSQRPPDWVGADDTDIWQLGTTLRPLLDGAKSTETSFITWLRYLVDQMAPASAVTRIPPAQEILERLQRRKSLPPSGIWGWRPVAKRAAASLIASAYEYHAGPLTTERLIDILLQERKPALKPHEDILRTIECDLSEDHATGPRSTGMSNQLAEEIAQRILFGLPVNESHLESAKEEWKYLRALIKEIPSRLPTDLEESEKYARAVVRQAHVQLSLWDAGVRFLTAGQGTHVYLCSGYEEFAISKGPEGVTDLRSTAIESLKRGAQFIFVVPRSDTAAATSAEGFVKYLKSAEPNLAAPSIKRVANRPSNPRKGPKEQVPQWMAMGQYFTPGFRYVIFKEEDPKRAVHDAGAFMVGLPQGTNDKFALLYTLEDRMAKDFLRWLALVGALKHN